MSRRTTIRPYVNSIAFNGTSSYLSKETPTGVNTGTNSRWGMCRIFLRSDALGAVFAYKVDTLQSPTILLGQLAGVYYFAIDTVNGTNNLTMTKAEFNRYFPRGKWIEFAWLITSTTITIWANHVKVKDAAAWAVAINTGTYSRLLMGKTQDGAGTSLYFLNAIVKDGLIGNGSLSQAEVDDFFYDGIRPSTTIDQWEMDTGSGTNVPSIGSNALTATSITWSTFVPMQARQTASDRSTARDIPYSVYINGVDGAGTPALSASNIAALNGVAQYTIRIRFYPTAQKAYVLYDNSQSGITDSIFLSIDAANSVFCCQTIGGISSNILGVAGKVHPFQWNTLDVAYNGATLSVFLNGALIGSLARTGVLGSNTGAFRIGAYWTGLSSLTFKGYIQRPILYSLGATLAEHKDYHFGGITSAAMLAARIMDAAMTVGSGSTIADASGNGNTMTLGSSASWSTFTPSHERVAAGARTDI